MNTIHVVPDDTQELHVTLAERAAQLIDSSPEWLQTRRADAADRLSDLAMPSPGDEVWRYVDLGFDLAGYEPAKAAGAPMEPGPWLAALAERSGHAQLIDGHVVASSSQTDVEVGPADGRTGPAALLDPGRDIFTAAHAAFSPGGLVINAPRNTAVTTPIVVDVQATSPGTSSYPSISIVAGENSELSVVIILRSPAGVDLVSVPHLEAHVGDGARLRVSTVQSLGEGARSVGTQEMTAGRDASIRWGEIGLGADYARLRLGVGLDGTGASFNGAGLYFGDRDQVHDYRVFITHRGPRTSSDLFLKGAVEDTAQAVWTGLVRIEQTARGTSAFETNRNLVLSEGAKVDSVPNLEILTDDLQCGHGSSSGPLEQEHLYYLMSRGIRRDRAERLLVRGFFEEIIAALPTQHLAEPTRVAVREKFVAAQAAGRVL